MKLKRHKKVMLKALRLAFKENGLSHTERFVQLHSNKWGLSQSAG